MPFATDTVHGLSADVYVAGVQQRIFGDVVIAVSQEVLDLTANDEGNLNPVDALFRGQNIQVTVPYADTQGLPTISGVTFPFATSVDSASGAMVLFPKPAAGDSLLDQAAELRLVARDGSATWIFASAAPAEYGDLVMSEENQQVLPVTYRCFRTTISGVETPVQILSGSVITGP